jgi:hypothetical protein
MQQNSGNTYSIVYMYRKNSNNQVTLTTDIMLRKRKKRRKSKTDDKLACCPQNNPLPLLISTRDPTHNLQRARQHRDITKRPSNRQHGTRTHTTRLCRHITTLPLTRARNNTWRYFRACLCGLDELDWFEQNECTNARTQITNHKNHINTYTHAHTNKYTRVTSLFTQADSLNISEKRVDRDIRAIN